jgi:hypothetical protein
MTTVAFYNDGRFIRLEWTGGQADGRKDWIMKENLTFQRTSGEFFMIKQDDHIIYLKYSHISTAQPTDHASVDQLLEVLATWCGDGGVVDPASDSLGRIRVSRPCSLFDVKFRYDKQPGKMQELLTGTGPGVLTHDADEGYVQVANALDVDNRSIFQSRRYVPHQPGKSQFIMVSAILRTVTAITNNQVRLGLFDDEADKTDTGGSGVFFQMDAAGALSIVRRTFPGGSQTDEVVVQADWNLDQVDGTGLSLVTLDPTKLQTFVFDIQVQASGKVRAGVIIDDDIIYAHEFVITNVSAATNLMTSSLPVRFESVNSGIPDSDPTSRVYAAAVISEGGCDALSTPWCADTGVDCSLRKELQEDTDSKPIISIRIKSTRIRAMVKPTKVSLVNVGNGICKWELVLNPGTLDSASWTSAMADSHVEFAIDGSSAIADATGKVVACGYVGDMQEQKVRVLDHDIQLTANVAGSASDVLTLLVKFVHGNSIMLGSIEWLEYE